MYIVIRNYYACAATITHNNEMHWAYHNIRTAAYLYTQNCSFVGTLLCMNAYTFMHVIVANLYMIN